MGRRHHPHPYPHKQHEMEQWDHQSPPSPEQQKLHKSLAHASAESEPVDVIIIGAGIVGLTMALALQKYCPNLKIEIYEQAHAFQDGIGAGIGMYPNGLRVLQDISKSLVQKIQHYGYPYLYRRWERHDGTEIVVAEESTISKKASSRTDLADMGGPSITSGQNYEGSEQEIGQDASLSLQPMGIRRWKLQKILYKDVKEKGIPIHFNKKVIQVHQLVGDSVSSMVRIQFRDGSHCTSPLVIAADGAKSVIRTQVMMKKDGLKTIDRSPNGILKHAKLLKNIHKPEGETDGEPSQLTYTGTTCLYGVASIPDDVDNESSGRLENSIHQQRGICFPSSDTTKCHGCFYPVSSSELCFQFHIPTNTDGSRNTGDSDDTNVAVAGGGWGTLLTHVEKDYCKQLATEFEDDGWHAKYIEPLRNATQAIKVPFALLNPPLSSFTLMDNSIVLVGDAAHPPVPYLGQGCQQGLEDAGTLALLLKHFCCDTISPSSSSSDVPSPPPCSDSAATRRLPNIEMALDIYNQLRVPRTKRIINELSQEMGELQQQRACGKTMHCRVKEEMIRRNVFFHETMDTILPGATYNYKQAIVDILHTLPLIPVPEEETDLNEEALQKAKHKRSVDKGSPNTPAVCRDYESSDDDLDWSQSIYTCH